jgi:hypothetical protein
MKTLYVNRPARILAALLAAIGAAVAIGLAVPAPDAPAHLRADYDTSPK